MTSVRPLSPNQPASQSPKRWIGVLAAIVGSLAAIALLSWPAAAPQQQPSFADAGADNTADAEPLSTPEAKFESPAVEALIGFVSAMNRGDAEDAVAFLADDVPEVVGLGTVSYPYSPTDPGLWDEGTLHRENVAGFVSYVSALNGSVAVSDCSGFADGPKVVIASCLYQAPEGLLRNLGIEDQAGRLFGFVVDGEVAGIAASGTYDAAGWERIERFVAFSEPGGILTRPGNGYSTGAAQTLLAGLSKMAVEPTPR